MDKKYDLNRFIIAQKKTYQIALTEIMQGKKRSHWMWYIFPQIRGLGRSSTSEYYCIHDLSEAKAFLEDSYLGRNLREISSALLKLDGNDAREVLGRPDDMKLKSSMTLFANVSEDNQVFLSVLDKYFDGKQDFRTLKILNNLSS